VIILDEQLSLRLIPKIEAECGGTVISLKTVLPGVGDHEIPRRVLQNYKQCTFVTINSEDFWQAEEIEPSPLYSIVCVPFPKEREDEIPHLLHQLWLLPQFNTKRKRCGNIIRLTPTEVQYYQHISERKRPLIAKWTL
jgi:hypothetical protein